jgi:hypothetical protein
VILFRTRQIERKKEVVSSMRIKRFALGAGVWALLIVLSLVSFADAQTTKKKKKHKTSSTATSQTSVSTQPTTDPTVVSRASDYQDSSSIIIPPTETLLNLDILTKAEQRSESLRKQRFDLVEKENSIQSRLDQIEIDIRPENIERQVAVMGTLRPEEIREAKRKSLDNERKNLQALLVQVQTTRSSLDQTVDRADQLVQKLRVTMEADIDKTLSDDKNNPQP